VLAQVDAQVADQIDTKKEKIGQEGAVEMARAATDVWAAKGKKMVHYNLKKDEPTDEDLIKVMIGPSGNLRAPTFRKGKKVFIGFHSEELAKFLA